MSILSVISAAYIVLIVLLAVIQVVYLIKAVRSKDNKNWLIFFTAVLSAFLCLMVLIVGYPKFDSNNYTLEKILAPILAFVLCLPILLIGIVTKITVKIINHFRHAEKNRRIDRSGVKKSLILLSVSLVVALVLPVCRYTAQSIIYSNTKAKELNKIVGFINEKYSLDISPEDCTYYREEDYRKITDVWDPFSLEIPYIAVFENGEEKITVVDRKGVISDSRQISELNSYFSEYFSSVVGVDIDFVEIRRAYGELDEQNLAARVIQTEFNEKITSENVEDLIRKMLAYEYEWASEKELIFYVKDGPDREQVIKSFEEKLSVPYRNNLRNVTVFFYNEDEELFVEKIEKELSYEYKDNYDRYTWDDEKDPYKFDYYHVPNLIDFSIYKYQKILPDVENFNTFNAYVSLIKNSSTGKWEANIHDLEETDQK